MTNALEESTEHQPRARVALTAALASGPSHAYLFRGPRGAGKSLVARAFTAEILAAGAADAEDARRRALLDPSPHPDLVWLRPRGAQHMVEEVREKVIRAASYRPFEAEKRVFVIEAAEQMRDESQNALLKTLEEPPGYAHLILLTSEPTALLETIASRCQPIDFAPLPIEAVEAALAGGGSADELAAAARLSAGDPVRARYLLSDSGRSLRAAALELGRAVGGASAARRHVFRTDHSASAAPPPGEKPSAADAPPTAPTAGSPAEATPTTSGSPWTQLIKAAESAGEEAEEATRKLLDEETEAGVKRSTKDITDEAKRAGRRRRTETLDLALELNAGWFRDLAATASGAADVVFNRDRIDELRECAAALDPARPRRAAELVQDTRRRLDLNVSEELALEALTFRLERVFA